MRALLLVLCCLPALLTAQEDPWPGQFRIDAWETERIGPTDVVGPDGIVYPDARLAGVQGGIPSIDERYRRFDVTDAAYGADGDDDAIDGDAVATAIQAAMDYLRAGPDRRACVYLPAGTYRFEEALPPIGYEDGTPAHHLVIQGAGPDRTTLQILDGNSSGQLITFAGEPDHGTPYLHLRETARRGAQRFLVAEDVPERYGIGDWISIRPTEIPADSTMGRRCNRPEAGVLYEAWHLGRSYFGRITRWEARALTFDHHILHDLYVDERPQIRRLRMIEYGGVQDLRIATESADSRLDPLRFDYAANCWLRNVHIDHPRNWPVRFGGALTHHEYRDCHFDGTAGRINAGGRAYLGWTCYGGVTHSLMVDCRANGLRHMPIFQWAAGCVVTGSRFTGDTVLALQCHGQFPHDILVDDNVFDVPRNTVGIDGTHSLRHGLEGPRFVMFNNRVSGGTGVFDINGGVEGHIYAYNRVRLDDPDQRWPGLSLRDRSWDGIFHGNVLAVTPHSPLVNIEDPTSVGWTITDNRVYGSNGRIWEGSARPRLSAGNRFHPFPTDQADLPQADAPVPSLYHWQLQHADNARLLLLAPAREAAAGGTVDLMLLRLGDEDLPAVDVQLSSDNPDWSPGTRSFAAGDRILRFTASVPAGLSGRVRLQARADGYLDDSEPLQVFDPLSPPRRGEAASAYRTDIAGAHWRAGDYGRVAITGAETLDGDRITLRGAGIPLHTWDGNLGRTGCRFLYQAISGDGGLVARLLSTDGAKQAGLRWIDDEATMTEHLHLMGDAQVLASPILNSFHTDELHPAIADLEPPVWLKLERRGAHFHAWYGTTTGEPTASDWIPIDLDTYKDHDHIDWYQDPADPDYGHKADDYKSQGVIDDVLFFGLFVNSGAEDRLATATFEDVRFFGEVVPRAEADQRALTLGVLAAGSMRRDLAIVHRGSGVTGTPTAEGSRFDGLDPSADAQLDIVTPAVPSDDG